VAAAIKGICLSFVSANFSRHAMLCHEAEQDAKVDLSGPRTHRQPVEGRKAHGAFYAGAIE
jgi:hypothetical protein